VIELPSQSIETNFVAMEQSENGERSGSTEAFWEVNSQVLMSWMNATNGESRNLA
jgi:hypothetical protein